MSIEKLPPALIEAVKKFLEEKAEKSNNKYKNPTKKEHPYVSVVK